VTRCFLSVFLLLSLLPVRGQARAGDAQRRASAREHYRKAEGYYAQGRFKLALEQYRRAMELVPDPALIFNMGQCHRNLGNIKQALFFYRLYLSKRPNAENSGEVRERVAALQKRLAALQRRLQQRGKLSLVTTPPGAEVRVDTFSGPAVAITPCVVALSSGQHMVQITKLGHEPQRTVITIETGKIKLLELHLRALRQRPTGRTSPRGAERALPPRRQPLRRLPRRARVALRRALVPPRPPPSPPAPNSKPFYKRWWFWSGAVAATGMIATGAYFGANALHLHDQWEKHGEEADRTAGMRSRALADGLLIPGIVLAAGVVLTAVLLGAGGHEQPRTTAQLVGCSAGACGLTGRF